MNQRLTRKEIKRDEVAEWFGQTAEFLRRHRTMLILSAVGAVAVVVVAVGGYWWLSTRSAAANELLARAMTVYAAPIDPVAPKPEDPESPSFADEASRRARAKELFEKLAGGFSFADASAVADVYLGRIAVADGDLDGAARHWRDFVDEHRGHVLASEVRVNLLALDRQQGHGSEVAGELEAMLTKAPDERPLPGDVILSELATTYEQLGRDDDAKSTWSRLAEEYPQSVYAAVARQKAGPALQALAGQGF